MAAIPLGWNDQMFNGVTNSGSVILRDGGTISNKSITDTGDLASVVGYGSFTVDGVRINSGEGVRIGGSGDIKINNTYIETRGESGAAHADGIQAYDPGGTGNVTITNSTIVSHNDNATAGMFVADDYNGTFTFNNVVFKGGPFGLRIAADDKDLSVSLKDVYFVGPFEHDPLFFQKVNADIHITQWDNVRYATIENGELVPGAPISSPFAVEGGATAPMPAPAPAPAPAPTPDTAPTAPPNAILGSTHRDTLTSTTGDDFFVGNGGSDTFVFADNFGNDTINDFEANYAVGGRHDTIQFSKSVFDDFASMQSHASQVGQDVVISTPNDSLTLKNATLSNLNHYDFHFA